MFLEILMYLMTVAWLWYGIALLLRQRALKARGVRITAHVKGNETGDNGRSFRPVLGYTYAGCYYEITCRTAEKTKYDVGTPMDVVFLPDKPAKAEPANTSMRSTIIYSLLVGAVSLAASVYIMVAW